MATKSPVDQFANLAILTASESAANTLTYKKLETGISLSEKVAWVVNRIEYYCNQLNATQFNSTDDYITFGLTVSNAPTTVSSGDPMFIDYMKLTRADFGTAANAMFIQLPIVKDFSQMPGGGLIVPPQPIYGFVQGSGIVAATTVLMRIYYTLLPLAVDQYWELIEARRVLAS